MYSADPGNVELVLYGDNGNLPDPSNEILRQSFNVAYSASGPITDWQGLTGLNLALSSGSYWISFEKSSPVNGFSVNLPSGAPNPLQRYAYFDEDTGGEWVSYIGGQGFRVGVSNVIPEPATISLLGLGLLGFVFKRKRTS